MKHARRTRRRATIETLEPRLLLDAAPPTFLEVWPLPVSGGSIGAVVDTLRIETSEEMQAAGVNDPGNWELRGAGEDTNLNTGDDVLIDLATDPSYASGTLEVIAEDDEVIAGSMVLQTSETATFTAVFEAPRCAATALISP